MIKTSIYYNEIVKSKIREYLETKEAKDTLLKFHKKLEASANAMQNKEYLYLDFYSIPKDKIVCYLYFLRNQGFKVKYNKSENYLLISWE